MKYEVLFIVSPLKVLNSAYHKGALRCLTYPNQLLLGYKRVQPFFYLFFLNWVVTDCKKKKTFKVLDPNHYHFR